MSERPLFRAMDPSDVRRGQLAAVVVEQLEALDDLGEDARTEETRPVLGKLGEAALALALSLDSDLGRLAELDRQFELLGSLLDVPRRLGAAGETTLAVRLAEALKFCAPDDMNGQIALAFAQAGERARALELVTSNLETAREPFISEFRAGDVYRELGEADAAEAYYRRSLELAGSAQGRSEAALRIASLLIDTGREADAVAFLSEQRGADSVKRPSERVPANSKGEAHTSLPRVGRNDPCPCGSGKKYKKCHGA